MASGEILSTSVIEYIEYDLKDCNSDLEDGIAHIKQLIDKFENEPIVQSFFLSGNFGKEEQEKLEKLKELLEKERNNICDNLIPTTRRYLDKQKQLDERGAI